MGWQDGAHWQQDVLLRVAREEPQLGRSKITAMQRETFGHGESLWECDLWSDRLDWELCDGSTHHARGKNLIRNAATKISIHPGSAHGRLLSSAA